MREFGVEDLDWPAQSVSQRQCLTSEMYLGKMAKNSHEHNPKPCGMNMKDNTQTGDGLTGAPDHCSLLILCDLCPCHHFAGKDIKMYIFVYLYLN